MNAFNIERNKQGVHIHITHKTLFFFVSFLMLLILVPSVLFGYQYYKANYYDSSTAKNELEDLTPPSVPSDIKNKLKQIDVINNRHSLSMTIHDASVASELQVPILMYHYIEYVKNQHDTIRISLNTTPYTLEEEIKTLIGAGYTFMTNSELADCLDGKASLPQKPILLTFDDGYRDFYTDAYPILKKYHVKATQYVISGFLNFPNHLLISQLQEIANDNLVEIGAHTVHHIALKGQPLKTVSSEVFQSRETLEQIIHKPVISFAYPFGSFDDQAIQVVKDAGFRTTVSTLPGIKQTQINRFFLFRLRPGGRIGQNLLLWLQQQ